MYKSLNDVTSSHAGDNEVTFKPIKDTYKKFTLAMAMCMLYPNSSRKKQRIIGVTLLLSSFFPAYIMWFFDVYFCIQNSDLDNLTRQLSLGIPMMFCQFKMVLINVLSERMEHLFNEINADYSRYNLLDEGYQVIVRNTRKSLLKLETVWTIVVFATVSAFPAMAAVAMIHHNIFKEPKRFMVHDMDVPWLRERRYDSPYFEIIFVYSSSLAFLLALCYLSYDGMFFVCIYHACLKMKLVGRSLLIALKDYNDVVGMRRKIAAIVEEQCEAFRFIDRIIKEYEYWLVLVFGLTAIQICMNMYQIISSSDQGIGPTYVIFVVAAILHIYVPCYLVSKLIACSADVADCAYCSGWEVVPDTGIRRSIGIIVARAQIPMQIQALNIITFNMELFVSVMHTSYSVFTLLRRGS